PDLVVSRVSAGTLDLRSDARGLAVDSALDLNLSYVRDLIANVRNRNVTGMSFGFSVVKDDWTREQVRSADGKDVDAEVRTLLEVRLPEVSGVTFPAYSKTQAGLKSVVAAMRSRVQLHGDVEAVERRSEFWPELPELCGVTLSHRTIIDLGSSPKSPRGDVQIEVKNDPASDRQLVELIRKAVRDQGGNSATVLGSHRPTTENPAESLTAPAEEPSEPRSTCTCGATTRESFEEILRISLDAIRDDETRASIPYQKTATSDKPWDAAANEKLLWATANA
ncbi:MAG: HK97 family phage prohead protease, partial [Actinobacteria bacterium]|nr:HK97 family phage prohead protease [Actinomycetota bacterium]